MRRDGRCKTAPYSSHPPAGEANLGSRGQHLLRSQKVADAYGKSLNFFIQLAPSKVDAVGRRDFGQNGLQQATLPLFIIGVGCREGVGWGRHPIDLTQFFGRKGVFKVGGGAFPVGHDGRLFGSREGA